MGFATGGGFFGVGSGGNTPNIQNHSLLAGPYNDGYSDFILQKTFTKVASDSYIRVKIIPNKGISSVEKTIALTKQIASDGNAVATIRVMKGTSFVSDAHGTSLFNMHTAFNQNDVFRINHLEYNIHDGTAAGIVNVNIHLDLSGLSAALLNMEVVIEEVFVS